MSDRTEYMRAYYLANRERILAYSKERYRKNKERCYAKVREWQKAHPLENSELHRKYYLRHAEERRAYQRAYKARKKGVVAE